MKKFLAAFLAGFKWFRKWYGGKWAKVFVGPPVYSTVWLNIPNDAPDNYREPLWEFIDKREDHKRAGYLNIHEHVLKEIQSKESKR